MMAKKIEAILFDMGGTLRSRAPGDAPRAPVMMHQMMELLGVPGSPQEFDDKLSRRAQAYKLWSEQTMRELAEDEIWTHWMLPDLPAALVKARAAQLNQLWHSAGGKRVIWPDAADVIRELARRGYRLGLVSNTTRPLDAPRVLKEIGVADCFEVSVLSATHGRRKPHPAMFLDAVESMQVQPKCSAYVGDQPERDVAGARRAGFGLSIILLQPGEAWEEPADPALRPEHVIGTLTGLLEIFP
jgi:putative hydrolase of the HAD superfamily